MTQDMKHTPTPMLTYKTGNFVSQTPDSALDGFTHYPNKDSVGRVLRAKDSVAWVLKELKDFGDVEGNLTVFPCEQEEDTVYLECPRWLWIGGNYPDQYDPEKMTTS